MSMLAPLYALGLLAVSLPIVFHLIRRMPKGEFQFSSLMFLSPSPPRLTKRSRIEHWLLLLLRGLALALLAFAFARPFLRQAAAADTAEGELRRVAIVVDTSASMRRGDLWRQATAAVDAAMAEAKPLDQVAVFTCDDTLRPLVSFEEMAEIPPTERKAAVRSRLAGVNPTWSGTQLGRALTDAVEIVSNVSVTKDQAARLTRRIVLVSDLQEGGRMDALAEYPWPEDVRLELKTVKPAQMTNAGVHWLAERTPTDENPTADSKKTTTRRKAKETRVSVSNDAASAVDQFRLTWIGADEKSIGDAVEVYVPAGESRVVRMPQPADKPAERLRLSGDDCEFDNTLYLASRPQEAISVVYLGDDKADDPQQLRYYFERALIDGLSQPVTIESRGANEPLKLGKPTTMPLVAVTKEPSATQVDELLRYAESGGAVLFVVTQPQPSAALDALLGVKQIDVREANVAKDTMLGQIAFDHPLFAAMAGPHFNDFTQIRFWKYRKLAADQLGDATIVARFENGDPAVIERRIGKGRAYVLTSGWQPSDSQLARSWKFVLLAAAMVDGGHGGKIARESYEVGEPVRFGEQVKFEGAPKVTKPDSEVVLLPPDVREFKATDAPGIYTLVTADGPQTFAVNLDPAESKTSPLPVETLEQFGCRLVTHAAVAENEHQQRLLRDVQLESRQKLWQWLIAAALGLLLLETWLAGRVSKTSLAKTVTA